MSRLQTRVGADVVVLRTRPDGRVTTASSCTEIGTTTAVESVVSALSWTLAMVRWAQKGR